MSIVSAAIFADDAGLAGRFVFDEGSGNVLHDRSGNGNDSEIVGARWVEEMGHAALEFRGGGEHVVFNDRPGLKIAGDMTVLAWVRLDASPYPDEATNWTIVDCEVYRQEGFLLRVDGGSARLCYRSNQEGAEQSGFGTEIIENHGVYLLGVTVGGNTATLFVNGLPDGEFGVQGPASGSTPFRIGAPGQSFSGTMFEVSVYRRALSKSEVAAYYWEDAARFGKDVSRRGRLAVTPSVYEAEQEVVVEVDLFGAMPLAADEGISVSLVKADGTIADTKRDAAPSQGGRAEYAFSLAGLADGKYTARAELGGGARAIQAEAAFDYPAPPFETPAPDSHVVGPIPVLPPPPSCVVAIAPSGGMQLHLTKEDGMRRSPLPAGLSGAGGVTACPEEVPPGGATYAVASATIESSFSIPGGGENLLCCGDTVGEAAWRPVATQIEAATWQVAASGKSYSLARRIKREPGRILISDTLTNTSDAPVGIIFHNRLGLGAAAVREVYIAGKKATGGASEREVRICPTVFASADGMGIGMAALDDVYIVQSRASYDETKGMDLCSREFALDAGASYTLEWAVYLNGTGDYFDMINAMRRDEGRNGVTVAGGLTMVPGGQQKRDPALVPERKFFDMRNLGYITIPCLSWCTDDPEISVEGIEFIEHAKERAAVRAVMDRIQEVRPGIASMFHIAHQLFATNRPEEHYPDSRVIDANGNQAVYPLDYGNSSYFSKRRSEDNWRWWIYYPTLENSFGNAMLDSVDVMMDEMGARGVFADGFLWGYGGLYTYDRWDGHSADIDPVTQTIQRTKASVLLVTQDAMIAWCKKIWGKGGVVIANGVVPTRTIGRLPLLMDKEVTEGPDVPLLTTPVTLGNPGACRTDADVYHDVLNKLRWGNLYFYYGEPAALGYASLPARMYPITVREVHAGCVRGDERIVTMKSGVYGWPGARDLHMVYRFDSRGRAVPSRCLTTADKDSVRTEVTLEDFESAVIERIPVQIETETPVNLVVERYDAAGLAMPANGQGSIQIVMPDGKMHEVILNGRTEIALP